MGKLRFKEYLPTKLVKVLRDIIRDERECRSKDNYIVIVSLIYRHQMTDESSFLQYSPLSVAYWRKVIGSHYSNYMSKLLSVDLIQSRWVQYFDDFGNSSNVLGYRINPAYINLEFSLVEYSCTKAETTADNRHSKATNEKPLNRLGLNPDLIGIQKNSALVWIDSRISSVVDSYMNPDYINGLPSSLPVLVRIYQEDSFTASHMSIESAQKIAEQQGKQLLYYKDKFIIAEEAEFRKLAKQILTSNYSWQVRSFNPDSFNFSRNQNTLRVYSKLTSLSGSFLPFIRINGQYIQQADLKCSQFTLFANLINYYLNHTGKDLVGLFKKKQVKTFVSGLVKVLDEHKDEMPIDALDTNNPTIDNYETNDVYRFLCDALTDDFYNVIKSELGLPLREHGKGIAFRTVFSKPKPENELVRQFRQLYPTVISIINDYKYKNGYNQFAIGLQRVEAEIFIDNIWKTAKQSGINCFTRHDSLVFPINKRKEVEKIIYKVFKTFNFIYRIKIEEFNTEEIMQRLVNRADYDEYDLGEPDLEFDDKLNRTTMREHDYEEIDFPFSDILWEQLQEIHLPDQKRDVYFEYVSLDALYEIYELEGLPEVVKRAIEEDILNLQSNYPIPQFQTLTNRLISWLIEIKGG